MGGGWSYGGSSFSPAINMNKEKADLIDRPLPFGS